MKIKRILLVALTALGLSLGVVGPVLAGSKPSVISGNTAGLVAPPAIAGKCGGCSGGNFRSANPADAPITAGSKPSVAPGRG
jgi:hypothetical protein